MYLVVGLTPSALTITPVNHATGAHRYLLSVGTLHMAASSGGSSSSSDGEAPSLPIRLTNEGRRLAAIAGCPLRATVDVYLDDGALFFSGLIGRIQFGRVIEWTLES